VLPFTVPKSCFRCWLPFNAAARRRPRPVEAVRQTLPFRVIPRLTGYAPVCCCRGFREPGRKPKFFLGLRGFIHFAYPAPSLRRTLRYTHDLTVQVVADIAKMCPHCVFDSGSDPVAASINVAQIAGMTLLRKPAQILNALACPTASPTVRPVIRVRPNNSQTSELRSPPLPNRSQNRTWVSRRP
jgi:hypothetical protein